MVREAPPCGDGAQKSSSGTDIFCESQFLTSTRVKQVWKTFLPGGAGWCRGVRGSGTRTSVPRVPRYIRIAYFLRLGYTAVFFILKSSIGPLRRTNFILRHFTFFSTDVFIQPTFTTAHVSTAATCHCMFLCGGDMPPHATKYGCKTDVQKNGGGIMQPHLRTAEVICHRTCQSAIALYHWTVFCGGKVPLHFTVFNCIVPRNNVSADAQLHSILNDGCMFALHVSGSYCNINLHF